MVSTSSFHMWPGSDPPGHGSFNLFVAQSTEIASVLPDILSGSYLHIDTATVAVTRARTNNDVEKPPTPVAGYTCWTHDPYDF